MTAANLPREARALLDAIAQGESDPSAEREGISPYVILYGGGSFEGMPDRSGYNGFPEWSGKDNSHAAGRYQFEPATWRGIVLSFAPASPNFRNPDDQDWGAWFLAKQDYVSRTGRRLLDDLRAGNVADIGSTLNPTWTSMSSNSFPSRYKEALAAYPDVPPGVPPTPVPAPSPSPAPIPIPPRSLDTSDVLRSWMVLGQDVMTIAGYYSGPLDGKPNDEFVDALQKYLDWLDAQGGRP